MAELKTKQNDASVNAFLETIADERARQDCATLVDIMKGATKAEPKMWGPSIVGFGTHRYKYESGREGDWFLVGFSPRKQALTLYLMPGVGQFGDLLAKLGKYKTGKGCLYVKRLEDVHLPTLEKLVKQSVDYVRKTGKG